MIGAIIGDIVGSRFEKYNIKSKSFDLFTKSSRFTDDTVLTVAIANALVTGSDFEENVRKFGRKYPLAGYGGTFKKWLLGVVKGPYNSWGNGSAMRVSPIGFAFTDEKDVWEIARQSAAITHNHPEGIKGAQAIAIAIFLAKSGRSKEEIKNHIESNFHYNLSRKIDEIREHYAFDVSCQGSVPESIIAFLESNDYEDAIRTAISIGGDSDTIACMAGGIAQAFYKKIPDDLIQRAREKLPIHFLHIIDQFAEEYGS